MSGTKITLRDRLTMIAAQARLISLAATGFNKHGTLADGDLTGVVELADRIEQPMLLELQIKVGVGETAGAPVFLRDDLTG
jgi:hypothetical protein